MKNLKRFLCIVMSYLLVINAVLIPGLKIKAASNTKNQPEKIAKSLLSVPGEIVVKVKKAGDDSFLKAIKSYNPVIKSKDKNLFLISVTDEHVKKVIDILNSESSVEYSEVNAIGHKNSELSFINSDDFRYYDNIMELWDVTNPATTVKVAVIDSGIDTKNPALQSNTLSGYNFIKNTTDITDDSGHGTQVSGIIAAKSDDANFRGVAGKTNTSILPLKAFDADGKGTTYDISRAINYAANHGAKIINMSFSGQGYSKLINDELTNAESKDCIMISSAGNDEENPDTLWPANSGKTLVVGTKYKKNNYGKYLNLLALGAGLVPDKNDSHKCVRGSSFAAAEISGVAAVVLSRNPNLNAKQIENLILKSSVNINYNNNNFEPSFNASMLSSSSSDFICIREPYAYDYYNSDVNLVIDALNHSTLSKLEIYLNGAQTPIQTISGTGASIYNYTIPLTYLNEGTNSIIIKSYDTSGKVYSNTRYMNKATNPDNMIKLSLKGIDGGALPENAKITLLTNDNNGGYSAIAATSSHDGSNAIFFNTSKTENYKVMVNYSVITNGITEPVITTMDIPGSGSYTVDSSKNKKLQLNAKKVDNTPLSSGILSLVLNTIQDSTYQYSNAFDLNGNAYVYISSRLPCEFKVLSKQDGYYYKKKITDATNNNLVNFSVDNSVCKLDVTNYYDSLISDETLKISNLDFENYSSSDFKVKDKSLYFTKGSYNVEGYSTTVTNGTNYESNEYNVFSGYEGRNNLVLSDSTYNLPFGEMKAHINFSGSDKHFNITMNDENGNSLFHNLTSSSFTLYDSMNNIVSQDKYRIDFDEFWDGAQLHFTDLAAKGSYYLEASVNMGILGTVKSPKIEFINDKTDTSDNTSGTVSIAVKSPDTTYQDINWMNVQIINANSGDECYAVSSFNSIFSIDKKYFDGSYKIKIQGGNDNSIFAYSRALPVLSSNTYTIDNSAGLSKKITFSTDTSVPVDILKNSNIWIGINSESLCDIKGPSSTIKNVYLDSDSYKTALIDKLDNYYLYNTLTIDSSNTACVYSIQNAAKFTFNASGIKNATNVCPHISVDSGILYKRIDSVEPIVKPGNIITVSPKELVSLNSVSVYSLDDSKGLRYNYNFDTTGNAVNAVNNIDFKTWNVNINSYKHTVNVPENFYAYYGIKCGGYSLNSLDMNYIFDIGNVLLKSVSPINLSLYDASDNLCSTTFDDYGYASNSYGKIPSNNLQNGNYYGKLILTDNIIGYVPQKMTFTSNTENLQKVRIMNPFNINVPAKNTKVMISSNTFYTDTNGYLYLNKGAIQDKNSFAIFYIGSEGSALYYPDTISTNSDFTINKAISSLKKVQIKAKDNTNSVRLENETVQISKDNIIVDTELDENAQIYVYLQDGSYNLTLQNGYYYLKGNYSTSNGNTFEIDNVNVCKLITSDKATMLFIDNSNPNCFASCYYISPGHVVNAEVTKNGFVFQKFFTTEANKQITFKTGNKLAINLQSSPSDMLPGQKSSINYSITDEYNNDVLANSSIETKVCVDFYKDGSKVASSEIAPYYDNSNFIIPFDLPSTGSMKVAISSPYYGSVASNEVAYNIDLTNWCKLTVYGPDGKLCTNGTVRLDFQGNETNISSNGSVYVKKCPFSDTSKVTIIGTDSTSGDTFMYNRDFNNADNTYKMDSTTVKLTYSSNLAAPSSISYSELYINNMYRKQISSNEIANLNGKFIYVDNGTYTFALKSENYVLLSKVDTSINNTINFDINNCGTISVLNNNNVNFTIDNLLNINICNSGKTYISAGSNVSYFIDDWEDGIRYSNEYTTEKAVDKTMAMGTHLNFTTSLNKTTFVPNEEMTFSLSGRDEYGSTVGINNYGNSPKCKVHFTDALGKELATADATCDSQGYKVQLPGGMADNVNFYAELTIGKLGSFTTSNIGITVDTSNYNLITVLDPYGNPADGGNIVLGSNTIKIASNGTAYISKDIYTCNAAVNGKCKNSDEYFLYKLVYDSSKTTISKGENEKLVNISLLSSNNGTVSGSFYIKDQFGGYGVDKYFEKTFDNSASSQNPWSNYKNFNIWLPAYNFDLHFDYSYDNGNDTKTKYMLVQKYDQSSPKIVFDESNCCKVNVGISSLLFSDSYIFRYLTDSFVNINKADTLYINKNSEVELRANYNGLEFSKEFNSGSNSNIYVNMGVEPIELKFTLPRVLLNNSNYDIQYSLKDSNGFDIFNYDGGFTTIFEKDGIKVAELAGGNITPTNIPSGDYDVHVEANIGKLGVTKSQVQKVYIADSSKTIKIKYLGKTSTPWNTYAYEILDSNGNIIFNGGVNNIDGIQIPKDKITYDKDYSIIISGNFDNGTHIYKAGIKFTNATNDYTVQEDDSLVNVTGSSFNNSTIINISQNGIKLMDSFPFYGNIAYSIMMSPGTYDVSLKGTDSSTNSTYVLNRSYNVSPTDNTFDFNLNNLCKLNLNSGFNKLIYGNVKLKSIGNNTEPTVIDLPTDTNLYVDKGVYSVTGKYILQDKYQSINIEKTLDCSGTEASLAAISNLSLSAVPASPSYNVGESLSANIEAYNNTDKLDIFTPEDFTITAVEVMHGTKVIKKLDNNVIPATLSGECNLRLTVHNDYIGDKQVIIPNVVINNPSCTAIGDINLDKILDLYDLVMISKDMGKTKVASPDWDGRCNIENASGDNVIDIKDMAAAAKNYNKKN